MNPAEAMKLVALTVLKPFTSSDYDAFSGVESDNPLIGENGDKVVVVDGSHVSIVDAEGTETMFELVAR